MSITFQSVIDEAKRTGAFTAKHLARSMRDSGCSILGHEKDPTKDSTYVSMFCFKTDDMFIPMIPYVPKKK